MSNKKHTLSTEEMIRLYQEGVNANKIAEIAGYKTGKSVLDKLHKAGVTVRTSKESKHLLRTYQEDLFEHIDAAWKGYFVGLMLTDGWVTQDRTVGYSSTDKDVVEYLSNMTGKSIQYVYRPDEKMGPRGKMIHCNPEYRLTFSSKTMIENLIRLGIVHNKSKILQGPELTPNEYKYIRFILRGIIDGDGTLGFPSNAPASMYFRIVSASEDFIDWCIWALEILGMTDLRKRKATESIWEVNTCQPCNIAILATAIYAEKMGMKRKRDKIRNHFFNYTTAALSSN